MADVFVLPFCSIGLTVAQLRGKTLMGQSHGEEETLRETTRVPRTYELMTIISPDVAEDELPAMIDRIGGYISAAGGTISETLRESPWGRRRLAYAIRHAGRDVRDGFYTVYHFDAAPGAINDIERDLRITDQVMRFLVTHYTPQPVSEQPTEEAEAVAEPAPAEVEVAAEVEAPVEEAPEAEPVVEEPVAEAVEAEEAVPIVEEPPVAEAVETEATEAPVKKPATRRKKAAPAEETETKDEESAE
jgi:small subunit ribosomal protein S6